MKHLLIVILSSIIFTSCHKDNPTNPNTPATSKNSGLDSIAITFNSSSVDTLTELAFEYGFTPMFDQLSWQAIDNPQSTLIRWGCVTSDTIGKIKNDYGTYLLVTKIYTDWFVYKSSNNDSIAISGGAQSISPQAPSISISVNGISFGTYSMIYSQYDFYFRRVAIKLP